MGQTGKNEITKEIFLKGKGSGLCLEAYTLEAKIVYAYTFIEDDFIVLIIALVREAVILDKKVF